MTTGLGAGLSWANLYLEKVLKVFASLAESVLVSKHVLNILLYYIYIYMCKSYILYTMYKNNIYIYKLFNYTIHITYQLTILKVSRSEVQTSPLAKAFHLDRLVGHGAPKKKHGEVGGSTRNKGPPIQSRTQIKVMFFA